MVLFNIIKWLSPSPTACCLLRRHLQQCIQYNVAWVAATVAATVALCIHCITPTGLLLLLVTSFVLTALFDDRKCDVRRRYATSKHRFDPSVFLRVSAQDVWVWPEGKRPAWGTCMDSAWPYFLHADSRGSRNIDRRDLCRALRATFVNFCSPNHFSND